MLNLATTHQNADLDGLASMVALQRLFGPLILALPGGMEPDTHRFWSEHQAVLPPLVAQPELRRRLQDEALGKLYVADTAVASRLGELAPYIERFAEVRAWDTHPPAAGDLPRAPMPPCGACTAGLVLELAAAKMRPTPGEAGLFLLGLHQDTGHFTFAGTTVADHEAAALCAGWGADLGWPGHYVPKGFTRAQLELLERMARQVDMVVDDAGLAVALVHLELPDYEPNLAVLLEQLREAEQWPAAVAVVACGERLVCVGRSRGAVDMADVMRRLHGGGHGEAASATFKGVTLAEALLLARRAIAEALGQQHRAGAVAARPVYSLPAKTPIGAVAEALHRRRVNAVPLVRGRGTAQRYVGLVARQDVDAALRHGLGERPASEISHQAPAWVAADAPLSAARQLLVSGNGRLLLVGTPPQALGVLTRGMLLRATAPVAHSASQRPPPPPEVMALVRQRLAPRYATVAALAQLADAAQVALHLVGGSVRDLFCGLEARDLDMMVEGSAPELAARAAAALGGEVSSLPDFGTARWFVPHEAAVDLASARAEYYAAPAALPEVVHASLDQDLFRRDFTVNAMALALNGPHAGRVCDPYGGFADLRAGVLRVLHGLSFQDDPTRLCRAVRLAARLDFALAPDTQALARAAVRAGVLERLSPERLGGELELILAERDVVQAFRLMRQWRLLAALHPALQADRQLVRRLGEVQAARLRLEGELGPQPAQADVLWVVLAAALPPGDRPPRSRWVEGARERRERFVSGPEQVAAAQRALASLDRIRWSRALAPRDAPLRLCVYAAAPSDAARAHVVWWEREGRHVRSAVDGNTLRRLGHRAGPQFKQALAAALDAARSGQDEAAQLQAALQALDRGGRGR